MGLNVILIVVGLIICFGGIQFKRICSGLIGLFWGVLGTLVFLLLTVGIMSMEDNSSIIAMIVCGAIAAALSSIYYKVCAALNGFLSSFSVTLLILVFSDVDSVAIAIILSSIIGIIVAAISVRFYDYSFIIITALSGAFIASIGGFGLIDGSTVDDILSDALWFGFEEMYPILIGTIALSIVGFCIQLKRLKKQSGRDSLGNIPVTAGIGSTLPVHSGKASVKPPVYGQTVQKASAAGSPVQRSSVAGPSVQKTSAAGPSNVVMNFCPRCGAALLPTDIFCRKCGNRLRK